MNQEYFTFELALSIHLGIPLNNMASVAQFEASNICTVPGVANCWYGVVNYKGSLLWVLDSDRFFGLAAPRSQRLSKLTTVLLKTESQDSQKQVAIVTQKLNGIVALEPSSLAPLAKKVSSQLQLCCSTVAKTESSVIHIIDPANLLQQLHQQSSLVAT
ncbi:MAG: CheW domain-containing protein [Cyanobacteria bacterium J06621_8]